MLNHKELSVRSSANCSRNNSPPPRNSSVIKNELAANQNIILAPPKIADPLGKRTLASVIKGTAGKTTSFEAQLEYLDKIEGQYRELIAAEEQVKRYAAELDMSKTQT